MTEFNLEEQIQDYLDSIQMLSHSYSSSRVYKCGINHLAKFVQILIDFHNPKEDYAKLDSKL